MLCSMFTSLMFLMIDDVVRRFYSDIDKSKPQNICFSLQSIFFIGDFSFSFEIIEVTHVNINYIGRSQQVQLTILELARRYTGNVFWGDVVMLLTMFEG